MCLCLTLSLSYSVSLSCSVSVSPCLCLSTSLSVAMSFYLFVILSVIMDLYLNFPLSSCVYVSSSFCHPFSLFFFFYEHLFQQVLSQLLLFWADLNLIVSIVAKIKFGTKPFGLKSINRMTFSVLFKINNCLLLNNFFLDKFKT
jgi:hypothetical protein